MHVYIYIYILETSARASFRQCSKHFVFLLVFLMIFCPSFLENTSKTPSKGNPKSMKKLLKNNPESIKKSSKNGPKTQSKPFWQPNSNFLRYFRLLDASWRPPGAAEARPRRVLDASWASPGRRAGPQGRPKKLQIRLKRHDAF